MIKGPIEIAIIQTWLTVHVRDLMRISEELFRNRKKKATIHRQMSATSMDRCRQQTTFPPVGTKPPHNRLQRVQ